MQKQKIFIGSDHAGFTLKNQLINYLDNKYNLICGTGIGISIAANKNKGIRCALCNNQYMAEMSRKHNNANVIALGGRVIGSEIAKQIIDTFISTKFENESRHLSRINKIELSSTKNT